MNLPRNIFLAALLTILCDRTHSLERSLDLATYQFRTCGKSGQNGPTRAECEQYYVGSALSGKLAEPQLEGGLTTAGVQYFEVPVADWYVLTVSGGRGGRGVCTRWAGRSPVIQNRVYLEAGAVLEVSVGHRGVDACDNNPLNVSLCHLSINTIEEAVSCSSRWQNISSNSNKDGSGGGGGGSLVRFLSNQTIAVLVGGGAGESAQFPNISEALNDTRERVKDVSLSFTAAASSGARPVSAGLLTAGRGGGYRVDILNPSIVVDGKDFLSQTFAVGGSDCFTATGSDPSSTEFFPGTCGGFGGGGGGCANGPGGGGYGGGSARDSDVAREGSGGMSFIPVGYQQLGWNDGDGFVDLRRENCGCAGDCVVNSSRSVFECMCPDNTTLSTDGFDCQIEADLILILNNSIAFQEILVDETVMLVLEPWALLSSQSVRLLSLSVDFQSSLGLPSMPELCGVVLADSDGSIVGVVRYQSGATSAPSFIQRVVQDNYTFSIGPPSTRLDRSLDFASAHLFKSKGDDCGIDSNFTANITILQGRPLDSSRPYPSMESVHFFLQTFLASGEATEATETTVVTVTLRPAANGWVVAVIIISVCCAVLVIALVILIAALCLYRTSTMQSKKNANRGTEEPEADDSRPGSSIDPSNVEFDIRLEHNPSYAPYRCDVEMERNPSYAPYRRDGEMEHSSSYVSGVYI